MAARLVGEAAPAAGLLCLLAGCGTPQAVRDAGAAPDVPSDVAIDAMVDAPVDASSGDDAGLPDLQLVGSEMADTWILNAVSFDAGACEVVEGCVGAPGERVLLRFDTVTANRGGSDVVIGRPPDAGVSNETFQWSACHKHHHVPGYTTYELVNDEGVVITGRKQSFCLEDDEPVQVGVQPTGYSCTNQGISRGWADVYTRYTACQWIDVTDLPHGAYTLRVTVNPEHKIAESSYDNNVFTVGVQF